MKKYIISLIVAIAIGASYYLIAHNLSSFKTQEPKEIRYVAVGDSYTIGEGVHSYESWPVLLVKMLNKDGIPIQLVANPSVTGWTTQNVIDKELPIYDASHPEFATLLIGVNDWVRGIDEETFHKNLAIIIDRMQKKLPDRHKMILVTIPDFAITPTGKGFENGRDEEEGIALFNDIIKEEAEKRDLPVVDIYPVSLGMEDNPDLLAPDGLHPSAKEYRLWTKTIYPVAYKLLKK